MMGFSTGLGRLFAYGVSFAHPIGYFCKEVVFLFNNYAVCFDNAAKKLEKPLTAVFRPSDDNAQRFVQVLSRGAKAAYEAAKFVKVINTGNVRHNTGLAQMIGLGFRVLHDTVNFLGGKKTVRSGGRGKNNQCRLHFAPHKSVHRSTRAHPAVLRFLLLRRGRVTDFIYKKAVEEEHGVFNNPVIVDNALDAVDPKCSSGLSLVTNGTKKDIGTPPVDPACRNAPSAVIFGSVAVVDDKKHRLEIVTDFLTRIGVRGETPGFFELAQQVFFWFNRDKHIRRSGDLYPNGVGVRGGSSLQPFENSHLAPFTSFSHKVISNESTPGKGLFA